MSLRLHVFAMVGLAVGLLAGLVWLLTGDRTSPLHPPLDDRTMLEVIRLAFYAVAGLGGVVALTVAYRRQRLNEFADEREDTKLFNERFAAAAEQLSSERASNRLAGVHAMAALADDWNAGRQTCVNVLCSYLRMPYEPPPRRSEREAQGPERFQAVLEERLVRHTVADVIGERLRAEPVPGRSWHWCDFRFNGATFDGGGFSDAVFMGEASFSYARFPVGQIDFMRASFHGRVRFDSAVFDKARLRFDGAVFGDVSFGNASMRGGELSFREAAFTGSTSFRHTEFAGGEVRFDGLAGGPGARFTGGSVDFGGAAFSGAEVRFADSAFEASALDMRRVGDWSRPPVFDRPLSSPLPEALRVTEAGAAALTGDAGSGPEPSGRRVRAKRRPDEGDEPPHTP